MKKVLLKVECNNFTILKASLILYISLFRFQFRFQLSTQKNHRLIIIDIKKKYTQTNLFYNYQALLYKAIMQSLISIQQKDNPQTTKKRYSSFRRFYTDIVTSVSPPLPKQRSRFFSITNSNKKIDIQLIDRQINKKSNISQKVKTQQDRHFYQSAKQKPFHFTFQQLRKKSLRKMELQAMAENKVKQKFGEKKSKNGIFFNFETVQWVEKKWNTTGLRGRYSEKMHPMCHIYEESADKTVSNRFAALDPFEGFQFIEF